MNMLSKLATGENWYAVKGVLIELKGRHLRDEGARGIEGRVKAADELGAIMKMARLYIRGQEAAFLVRGNAVSALDREDGGTRLEFHLNGVTKL